MSARQKLKFIGTYGSDSHVRRFTTHENENVRRIAAEDLPVDRIGHMVHDESPRVRVTVAGRGHKPFLDHLANDPFPPVRRRVAALSVPHHDKLKDDPDVDVRRLIASKSFDSNLLRHMSHDKDDQVRLSAVANMHPEHMDHLVHDPVAAVREAVAMYGTSRHRDALKNDPDKWVRFHARRGEEE